MPGKERQKKWKQKQLSKGFKPVTLMLSKEAKAIMDQERLRTGETLSTISNKIILDWHSANRDKTKLSESIDSGPSPVIQTDQPTKRTPAQEKLLNAIANLRQNRGSST